MEYENEISYRMARGPGQQRAMGGPPEVGSLPIRTRPRISPDMGRVWFVSVATQTDTNDDASFLASESTLTRHDFKNQDVDMSFSIPRSVTIWNSSYKELGMVETGVDDDLPSMDWLQIGESVDDLSSDEDLMDDALVSELEAASYALEHSLIVEPVLESVYTPESQTVTVKLPNPSISCEVCREVPGGPVKAQEHFAKFHRDVSLLFQCEKCDRSNPNPRSILSHTTKCRGVAPCALPANGDHECGLCGKVFDTTSGLSQHKRHQHPVERNEERIAAVSQPARKKGRRLQIWSQEEIERLSQLETRHAGKRNINKLIAEELGNKSHIQVGEKRRQLRESAIPHSVAQVEDVDPLAFLDITPEMSPVTSEAAASLRHLAAGLCDGAREKEGSLLAVLQKWVNGKESIDSEVEAVTARLLSSTDIRSDGRTHCLKGKRNHQDFGPKSYPWMRRRAVSRAKYGKYQCLFSKDRARLAALILDGAGRPKCRIPLPEVHVVYKEKWESRTRYRGLGAFRPGGQADNSVFHNLITEAEIWDNLKAMNHASASGPDHITWHGVKRLVESSRAMELFNTWWATGRIPVAVKRCRSILLPKTSDEEQLVEIGNWRPITIGSMVLRLFSRILTRRLAVACPLNPRQRGFVQSPGCSENLMIFDTILEQAKRERKQLAVAFIDVAKAFDTVSHDHIVDVLRRRGLDDHVIGIIQDSYRACHTSIEVEGAVTPEIAIQTGVKQGDPMSPLLFNLAIDPLIQTLEDHGCGFQTDGGKVTALAFADDLVLLSDGWDGMNTNLSILEKFCNLTGLKAQAKKCHGFLLTPTHDSYTVNNCQPWKIEGADMHMVGPEESEKYLGVHVGPWRGILKQDMESQLQVWIQRIDEAPLKPSQKVVILNEFALPRLIYSADHANETSVRLTRLDGMVKRAVKAWLRLPQSTCDGLLYSWRRDGGLGIQRLADAVPSIQVRRIQRVAHSRDPTIRRLMGSPNVQKQLDRAWTRAGGTPDSVPALSEIPTIPSDDADNSNDKQPLPRKESYPVPRDWRKDEFERWCSLSVQGVGVQCFQQDRVSNHWLRDHSGFRERHFIAALQLRANVYPTRECLNRGRRGALVRCRKCSATYESCSHILGQCPAVQAARITRHNKICDILVDEAKELGCEIHKEPRLFTVEGELRKPDLIFKLSNVAIVVDVTVRWEYDSNSLAQAARDKVEYYQHLEQQVKDHTGTDTVHFFGFPVGARGKWYEQNNAVLHLLGVTDYRMRQLGKLFSRRALLYSLDILAMFGGGSYTEPNG